MSDTDTLQALARRVARLEAMEDIRRLRQMSAEAADPFMEIDALVGLYVPDGVMEFLSFGTSYRGHDQIRAFLEVNAFTWMFHCLIPLRIDVADDLQSATARWYLLEAATVHNGRTGAYDPVWLAGRYEDRVVRVDGQWKFAHTSLTLELLCDYAEGWGTNRVNVNPDWVGKAQALMETIRRR